MTDRQLKFLEGCCELADGVAIGEGAFAPGPALWVGQREVAHFDSERTLDVRLTKSVIRQRREELKGEGRVSLRSGTSDWLEMTILSDEDLSWATRVVLAAIAANLPTAMPGLPRPEQISSVAVASTDTGPAIADTPDNLVRLTDAQRERFDLEMMRSC